MFYFWTPKLEHTPPLVTLFSTQKEQQYYTHYSKEKCLTQILNELDFYLIWVVICIDKNKETSYFMFSIFHHSFTLHSFKILRNYY